ncbi:multidrug effflux MFS transporter [Wolbachia endosymbiont of Diaphorina citri]|uniref:multidrug effflux MFS transporter n=1 Tax=Wolbachia endosymbiont of Diaphorina citri TaxID=116598 RepID=UPI000305F0DF|nr:multidrug effflux MFS transporter [Wolbachia endosymbiont of Diaphorina citri]QJT94860.1 multidrug effflux MFS transporter [Wolbachia endosymbiont of Diaphorina citri]QJT96173.1 multidrug effflux MFS transporter [Wolbachia endosymbiont of Diaphorina citri]QLK11808.1 multidrug effflux MFS transporter [Wolbachia endosymbiont of Diaphorina citri]
MLLPFLLILSLIAKFIEIDISVPSFPDIVRYFNVPEGTIQLTIAYNFLGFCIGGLFFGPLSECYGRRRMMIIGNTFLLIGAVGCVVAPSVFYLLISRFIQGIGASTSVVVFAIIADSYKGEEAVKFIGIMNSVLTIIMAIAPVLGSFINEIVGWRGNYTSVAILCFISWVLLIFLLPETKKDRDVFSLKKMMKDYKKLLSSSKFMVLSLQQSLFSAAYMSFITCGPFLYMETFGLSSTIYALHQGAIVGSFSLISLFSIKILKKFGAVWCVISGTSVGAIGSLLFVILSVIMPHSFYLVTLSMIIFSIGCAICQPVVFNASINVFPEIKGTASSALSFIRAFVMAIFIGLTSYVYNGQVISAAILVFSAVILIYCLLIVCKIWRDYYIDPSYF